MATIRSAHLTIAAGPAPRSVVVSVHGALGTPAAASLRRVLDGILKDPDIATISVDLHDVRGVDVEGLTDLAAAVERADQLGAELTLRDPPELLCQALEMEGLTGLVRMSQHDRNPLWSTDKSDRCQSRRNHPAGRLPVL